MSPGKFLLCVSAKDGRLQWRNQDDDLLEAIGPNERAQHFMTGYATTCYMKCNDEYLFFAGPQRKRMVVASTKDGKLRVDVRHRQSAARAARRRDLRRRSAAGGRRPARLRLGQSAVVASRPPRLHTGYRLRR